MKLVNVTRLRRNISVCLAQVRSGARLRITSHGEVIAEISPPTEIEKEISAARRRLRGSVARFDDPTEPVIHPSEWEVNR